MDQVEYRLDQSEKRIDALDARLQRIEQSLGDLRLTISTLATRDTVLATRDYIRGWGIGIIIAVIATGATMGGLLLQSSANQLSAFQAGLSAVQAVVAAQSQANQDTRPNRP